MSQIFKVEYPIRFSHCDPAGIVYFPRFFDLSIKPWKTGSPMGSASAFRTW